MNVLKKSALALAVAGFATSASAATIFNNIDQTIGGKAQDTWVLSEQGVEVGEIFETAISFDLKLAKTHTAYSEFVVKLPETVDLQSITSGSYTLEQIDLGGGNSDIAYQVSTLADDGSEVAKSPLYVRVGTASFTFASVDVDTVKREVRFISGVGQPLNPGASIELRIGSADATAPVAITGAGSFSVDTYERTGEFIETAETALSVTADQFSLELIEGTSELVDRIDPRFFAEEVFYNDDLVASGATTANITHVLGDEQLDKFELRATTNEGLVRLNNNAELKALADPETVTLVLKGDYSKQTANATRQLYTFDATAGATPADVAKSSDSALVFPMNVTALDHTAFTTESMRFALDNDNAAAIANLANAFKIEGQLQYQGVADATKKGDSVVLAEKAFGEWVLDQAIINVPYMPIGYKASRGLDSVFEISNRGNIDAEIKVKAFDQYGNEFGPVALLDAGKVEHDGVAKAKTVVKVSADDVLETFGLKDGAERKMNITFMIDAKRADIDLVPYYNDVGVRSPIINSQYKDGAERR
jgi:hypothetical protein